MHPEGRTAVFVGDLVDRGPDSPGVLRLVMGMVAAGTAICVPGNHEQKLARKLNGRNVQLTHGLPETLAQLAARGRRVRRRGAHASSTAWSATTCWTAAGWWSRTPG